MAEYILETVSVEPAQYKVHNLNCGALPATEGTRYLGSYGNQKAAIDKAVNLLNGVEPCPDCLSS
ncbi:hypothetical protein [Haliea sp. E17]|uniref:hypothetical protein n=1 Tax=Haliea sp. E17 TaxID=3401576 RepID=UPI003AAD45D1